MMYCKLIKIDTIPHISLLGNGTTDAKNNAMVVEDHKSEMANLLFQVHQLYRSADTSKVAIELTWITKKAINQLYEAYIDLYITIRTDDTNTLDKLSEICKSSLFNQSYDIHECNDQEKIDLMDRLQNIANNTGRCARCVVKDVHPEPVSNNKAYYPYYDTIARTSSDIHKIVNTLINYPDCAFTIQLIADTLTATDKNDLHQWHNELSSISSTDFSYNVAKLRKLYSYYLNNKDRAAYRYNIVAWGDESSVTAICSRVIGMLNNDFGSHQVNTMFLELSWAKEVIKSEEFFKNLPWEINKQLINKYRNKLRFNNDITLRVNKITIDECVEFFCLPIGNEKISAGLPISDSRKTNHSFREGIIIREGIINSASIKLGALKTNKLFNIGINFEDLAKHILIVGTPGSGKTTFSLGLLLKLWEKEMPFLVIEPAKNEYRALLEQITDLQIFTPRKNDISPFIFNPFIPPKNVKLEAYKSVLKTAFTAGASLGTPLDIIFEETVNRCYSKFGWLDTDTIDTIKNKSPEKIFNITDFIQCFEETFKSLGYKDKAENIGVAGKVRLKSLEYLFDNYDTIPIEDILTKPTIIELAAIENTNEKALIISLILLSISSYLNANYEGNGGFNNLILLEEAHVLLGTSGSNRNSETASSTEIAQELLKRMLAEVRSYGVGIAIADQSPRKVGADVVGLTDIKMAFRLVETQDKQIIADSCGMEDSQMERLARLRPGEAFCFFNKLDQVEEVITPDHRKNRKISISIKDDEVANRSTYWKNHREKLQPYPECKITTICNGECDFKRRLEARASARAKVLTLNESLIKYVEMLNALIKNPQKNQDQITELRKKNPIWEIISNFVKTGQNKDLKYCTLVHFLRMVYYQIPGVITSDQIKDALKHYFNE